VLPLLRVNQLLAHHEIIRNTSTSKEQRNDTAPDVIIGFDANHMTPLCGKCSGARLINIEITCLAI
jgi:hypothetical protein